MVVVFLFQPQQSIMCLKDTAILQGYPYHTYGGGEFLQRKTKTATAGGSKSIFYLLRVCVFQAFYDVKGKALTFPWVFDFLCKPPMDGET